MRHRVMVLMTEKGTDRPFTRGGHPQNFEIPLKVSFSFSITNISQAAKSCGLPPSTNTHPSLFLSSSVSSRAVNLRCRTNKLVYGGPLGALKGGGGGGKGTCTPQVLVCCYLYWKITSFRDLTKKISLMENFVKHVLGLLKCFWMILGNWNYRQIECQNFRT